MPAYDSTRRQFGRAASAYTESPVHRDGEDLQWLVEAAEPSGDDVALDLGSGAGFTAFALAPHVHRVIAADITPEMIDESRQNAGARAIANFDAVLADAEDLPFADASFNIVVCRYAAHHFLRPATVLSEVARVLRPRGRFVLIDNIAPDDPVLDEWINMVEKLRDPSHVREWTEREWRALFTNAGLTFEMRRTWLLPLQFDEWVERQQTPPDRVAALRALFDGSDDVTKETFAIGEGDFSLWTGLMVGVKPLPLVDSGGGAHYHDG